MLFTLPKQSPNQHTKPHGLSVSYAAACGVPLTTEEIKIYDNIPPCSKTISDYVLHKIGNGLALYEPLMDQIHTYVKRAREQRVKLYELQKKNPCTTKRALARKIQVKLIRDRAELEGRELTMYEIDVAFDLKDVIYWAPPTQLEGEAPKVHWLNSLFGTMLGVSRAATPVLASYQKIGE
uniref:Uncharacterized protein n=1 Tax=Brassica campestris TaxID=3711 RepID=M4FAM7_BRACM